ARTAGCGRGRGAEVRRDAGQKFSQDRPSPPRRRFHVMAAQTSWSGFLKVSLVSCPVRLYPVTTRANRITFHNLAKATHNRVEMVPHDAETGEEVDRDHLVRGYEAEKGRF